MLKVVLLGYGELALSLIMGILDSGHEIAAVMRWENKKITPLRIFLRDLFFPDALTSIIKVEKIPLIKAHRANSKEFADAIKKISPDVILVGAWGEIIKKETISLAKVAFINCHPSMLPKHRGANPYYSVIKNNESKTGITFHLVSEGIDCGEIILQKEIEINGDDNGETVRNKCAYQAMHSVGELLKKLENAELIPQKQNEAEASYFPRAGIEESYIKWNMPAADIDRQIRALYPWAKCYTLHRNIFLFFNSAKIVELKHACPIPGIVLEKRLKGSILVSTGDPLKGILAENIQAWGFLSSLWTGLYISQRINVGDSFM